MEEVKAAKVEPRAPWGPLAAIGVTIAVYFASQLLGGTILYSLLTILGWDSQRITAWFSGGTISAFIVMAVVQIITFLLIYSFIRYRKAGLGVLGVNRPKPRHIGYALAGFLAYFPLYILVLSIIRVVVPSLDVNQKQQLGFQTTSAPSELALVFIALVVLPPILEELIYRGFLFSGLKSKLPVLAAAIVTSLLFATPHLQIGSGRPPLWVAFIDTFILSIVLVYLRVKSGSLWPSIGLHAIKNGVAFVALFILGVS